MSIIHLGEAAALTAQYLNVYLDPERTTAKELAALRTGASEAGDTYLTELHAALLADDRLSQDEISKFTSLDASGRLWLAENYAQHLEHAWIQGFAPRLDQDWENTDFSPDEFSAIQTSLHDFEEMALAPNIRDVVRYHRVYGLLVAGGITLKSAIETLDSNIEQIDQAIRLVKNATPEARQEIGSPRSIARMIREARQTQKSYRKLKTELIKSYGDYREYVQKYAQGQVDPKSIEADLKKQLGL